MTSFDYNYHNAFRCNLCSTDSCHAQAMFHKRKNTEYNSLPQSILVLVVKWRHHANVPLSPDSIDSSLSNKILQHIIWTIPVPGLPSRSKISTLLPSRLLGRHLQWNSHVLEKCLSAMNINVPKFFICSQRTTFLLTSAWGLVLGLGSDDLDDIRKESSTQNRQDKFVIVHVDVRLKRERKMQDVHSNLLFLQRCTKIKSTWTKMAIRSTIFVCFSVTASVCLPIWLSAISLSVCFTVSLSRCFSVSVSLSPCLSVCLTNCF